MNVRLSVPSGIFIILLLLFSTGCKTRKITITFGTFAGSAWNVQNPDTYKLYDRIIADFERIYPQVHVTYSSGTMREDYSEWLSRTILEGKEPDIFLILPEDFNLFAEIGILNPLDTFMKNSSVLPGCIFFAPLIKAGQYNGRQYALPFECDPTLMFVNTTLLEKEHIPFPSENWTWDDLLAICAKITKDTDGDGVIDQFGITGFNWETALYTNRTPLFSDDGTGGLFDTDGVYDTFVFLEKLAAISGGQKVPDFDSGRVAFDISAYSFYRAYGYYPYSILKNNNFTWKATVLPRGPHGMNAAQLKILSMGISRRSRHKKEAEALMEFILTNASVQTKILEQSKGIPVRKDILSRNYVRQIFVKDISRKKDEISTDVLFMSIDDAMIIRGFRRYRSAVSMIDKELTDIPASGTMLGNFLSQINIKVNAYLAQ